MNMTIYLNIMKKRMNKRCIKVYVFSIVLLCFYLFSCGQPAIERKRKETMTQIINAISNNDTVKLYSLIDTGHCFYLNNKDVKEWFMEKVFKLQKKLSKNKIEFKENDFVLIDNPSDKNMGESSYKIIFDLQKGNTNHADLIFRFHNEVYKYVYDFDVTFRRDKPALLNPVPN